LGNTAASLGLCFFEMVGRMVSLVAWCYDTWLYSAIIWTTIQQL